MANTVQKLDTANLFVGDDDPNASLHLQIRNVGVILDLEEATETFKPGGHVMSIDYGTRSFMLGPLTFELEGINPDVMSRFMGPKKIKYTVRGNIRDLRTDADIPLVSIIEGRMVKVTHGAFSKGDSVNGQYEIKEISHYEVRIDGREELYVPFFEGISMFRRRGQPMFPDLAANLGVI